MEGRRNVGGVRQPGGVNYDIPDAAAELARWQAGAISRRQLPGAGLTAQMITTRLVLQQRPVAETESAPRKVTRCRTLSWWPWQAPGGEWKTAPAKQAPASRITHA